MATKLTPDQKSLLRAWGCPEPIVQAAEVCDDVYPPGECSRAVKHALLAINGYPEHEYALVSAVIAGQAAELREWAQAAEWEKIGRETSDDPDTEGPEYAESVREAICAVADAAENEADDDD